MTRKLIIFWFAIASISLLVWFSTMHTIEQAEKLKVPKPPMTTKLCRDSGGIPVIAADDATQVYCLGNRSGL